MITFESFEACLQDALAHLYDPAWQPGDGLYAVLGCSGQEGIEPVQSAILQAIERLRPGPSVPSCARSQRIYDVLSCRYVQQLTQEETAERLAITPRHLRREQREATNMLARNLWKRYQATATDDSSTGQAAEASAWRVQVRQELDALQKSAPGSVANVRETLTRVVDLARTLADSQGVGLQLAPVEEGLIVAIHPSSLRQVVLGCITELLRHMSSGEIHLEAVRLAEGIRVTVSGSPTKPGASPAIGDMHELLTMLGGTVQLECSTGLFRYAIDLARADAVKVLVVDDNADLVHFYRRYLSGTRYSIVGVAEGQDALKMVQALTPDVIVLDVMLPDADGWEILTHLHQDPATCHIPVIVCSVVREKELSLALGARLYVPKPVRRAQFIEALDRALSQAAAGVTAAPGSNAATG